MTVATQKTVQLGTSHFKVANERIREELENTDVLELTDVFAQRYIGCTLPEGKVLKIQGTPGNDMACYMDGGTIEVFGNAQDQIGNTMNNGEVVIHGRCGDAAGYAMRGGRIFIRDDAGWRVGIHMKQYEDRCPVIVIGGDAGSFLGEYMAGGIILLLGNPGEYAATGMHGGRIYLKEKLPDHLVGEGLVVEKVDQEDAELIKGLLEAYDDYFEGELDEPASCDPSSFYKLYPATSRPYQSLYAK